MTLLTQSVKEKGGYTTANDQLRDSLCNGSPILRKRRSARLIDLRPRDEEQQILEAFSDGQRLSRPTSIVAPHARIRIQAPHSRSGTEFTTLLRTQGQDKKTAEFNDQSPILRLRKI